MKQLSPWRAWLAAQLGRNSCGNGVKGIQQLTRGQTRCLSTSHVIWKFNDVLHKGPPRLALSLGATDLYLEGFTSCTVTRAELLSDGLLCSALLGFHESNGEQAPGTSAQRRSSLFQLDAAHCSAANVLHAATPKGQQDPINAFSKRHLRGDQLRYGRGGENLTAKQPCGALPFEAFQPGQLHPRPAVSFKKG